MKTAFFALPNPSSRSLLHEDRKTLLPVPVSIEEIAFDEVAFVSKSAKAPPRRKTPCEAFS
ncbi:hypothetical protein [Methanoculleus sp.]|uniref:hypothetical protein n=1 Tax=Methanoculleus sp. TaxID=90427 RepID=UPI001BD33B53|nr:hypothetical protein [Methanoculleus sp.]